jgi:type II secretory pathway component PulM
MKLEELLFWRDMTMSQRRLMIQASFLLVLLLLAGTWLGLHLSAQSAQEQAQRLKQRYAEVLPMVEQALNLQSSKGDLAGMAPMPAAQQVIRELGLEDRLASIRPTQLGGGGEGVQLVMEAMNLPELIKLMKNLRSRGGLSVLTFNLGRRLDNTELADLKLVLGR